MRELIYCGALRIQTNAHLKPRGKRKVVPEDLKEYRDVDFCVWSGTDIEAMNKRPHMITMICKLANIKNRDAVKIIAIKHKKTVGKTNLR